MPVCTLHDLKQMEPFLLRNLARHLNVQKWGYKTKEELISDIMRLQGEGNSPPVVTVDEDTPDNITKVKVGQKPRVVITPISEAIAAPIPVKPKLANKKTKKPAKSPKPIKRETTPESTVERPALYGILMQMARGKETDKDVIVKEAQEVYPEKSRRDILKTWSVVKCHHKKQRENK